ncbi:hypothetical protein AOB54_02485 [beta proteobacterium MWH-UniP1]
MNKKWENDSCEAVQAYFTVYRVPVAAALWCGIPMGEVDEHLSISTESARGIFKHPYISCLEPRCRAIHDAIEKGLLPCSRENGKVVDEHVAPERRHVSRQHLKDWIASQFPSDKPEFLFDDIERNTHSAIKTDAFLALQAERDGLKARLEKAADEYRNLRADRNRLADENEALLAKLQTPSESVPAPRTEASYLNIIGSMLRLFLMKTPSGQPHSVFKNQTAVVEALVAHFPRVPGVSKRNLEEKFPLALNQLDQT